MPCSQAGGLGGREAMLFLITPSVQHSPKAISVLYLLIPSWWNISAFQHCLYHILHACLLQLLPCIVRRIIFVSYGVHSLALYYCHCCHCNSKLRIWQYVSCILLLFWAEEYFLTEPRLPTSSYMWFAFLAKPTSCLLPLTARALLLALFVFPRRLLCAAVIVSTRTVVHSILLLGLSFYFACVILDAVPGMSFLLCRLAVLHICLGM